MGGSILARLVIVSNRVAHPGAKTERAGGLAVALREALARHGGLWFGWSGETVHGPSGEVQLESDGRKGDLA